MAENSKIEWTDHTFNSWIGCTKVSPGCANCYAESQDKFRHWTPEGFGKGKRRKRTSKANWNQVLRWNDWAAERCSCESGDILLGGICSYCGETTRRPRVFCGSLCDWLDDEVPIEWTRDLLNLVRITTNLDWQFLTKRPENWRPRLEAVLGTISVQDSAGMAFASWLCAWLGNSVKKQAPSNVWIGTTVENQEMADKRIPELLKIPAKVRFLSCEPLLGAVDVFQSRKGFWNCLSGVRGIHWVIAGGESGANARPMHPDWARSLRDQCAAAGVPYFFKQFGEWKPLVFGSGDGNKGLPCCYWDETIVGTVPGWQSGMCTGGQQHMVRVGKKAAGSLLDGVEHKAMPRVDGVNMRAGRVDENGVCGQEGGRK